MPRAAAAKPSAGQQELMARIRAEMGRQRMSQMDLVRATGISQSKLNTLWQGRRQMLLDEYLAIARAVGLDAAGELQTAYAMDARARSLAELQDNARRLGIADQLPPVDLRDEAPGGSGEARHVR